MNKSEENKRQSYLMVSTSVQTIVNLALAGITRCPRSDRGVSSQPPRLLQCTMYSGGGRESVRTGSRPAGLRFKEDATYQSQNVRYGLCGESNGRRKKEV